MSEGDPRSPVSDPYPSPSAASSQTWPLGQSTGDVARFRGDVLLGEMRVGFQRQYEKKNVNYHINNFIVITC